MLRILLFITLGAVASALLVSNGRAQVFGANLVMNSGAESGSASSDQNRPVTNIPGWNRVGNPDVVAWGSDGRLSKDNAPGPLDRGNNYFIGGPANASSAVSQDIDVSSSASAIDAGVVVFAASAYLGGIAGDRATAALVVTFSNSGGQAIGVVTLGPVSDHNDSQIDGLFYRRQIGLVPASTRKINVTLQFTGGDSTYNFGSADNVSLVLNTAGTAQSVLGVNLIQNGDAEAAPAVHGDQKIALDVPGWSRTGQFDVEHYSASGQVSPFAPGPANRGLNYFTGGPNSAVSTAYQDIDVSSATATIDGGMVQYNASAWLGGNGGDHDNAVLSIRFEDWSAAALANVQLGPVTAHDRNGLTSLLLRSQNGPVPPGTRQIHVVLTMTRLDGDYNDGYADNISLSLLVPTRPSINANGVISASDFGASTAIAPGTWIEIYGSSMSQITRNWTSADFVGAQAPTSLSGVSVTVGGQPAYVGYISLNQVNALVPSSVGPGLQQVTVTSPLGTSDAYTVTVIPVRPGLLAPASLRVNGKQYVAAIFTDGAYALPSGAISGVNSRPAKPGDIVTLYGIGFGPVVPNVAAGTVANQMTMLATPLQILFNNTPAGLTYSGLAPGYTGLYQFNLVVPNIPDSDAAPISFSVGGVGGAQTLFIAVHH
jgi:uncharacterized protein (TIGR03437 family)